MNFPWLHNIALSAGFSVQRWPFVWLKPNFHSNQAAQYNMTKCTEIALIARKGGILLTRNDIPNFVIHPFGDDMTSKMRHPFAKPFGVWKPLIEAVSLPGQLIYEPFMGEGSGVISMLQLGRNVVATEKVPEHFNAGLEQIKQFYLKQNGKVVFR
jgi:DNA modification methylase